MALIDHIDGPNRRIYLGSDSASQDVHPIDIYKEMRTLRRTDETLRRYDVFLSAFGNVSKGPGKATERYVRQNSGTRIVPYDADHTLTIIGTVITDDGQEGVACFDRSLLTPGVLVDVDYQPPQVEVLTVSTGSGLDATQDAKLMSLSTAELPQVAVDTASSRATVEDTNGRVVLIEGYAGFAAAVEGGRWLIENNQMIFYASDNVTEVARFNLFDEAGLPTETEVFERVRV